MRALTFTALGLFLCSCSPPGSPPSIPTPTRLPSPTADVRVGAADAYLTALTAYHAAIDPVQKSICATANTTPALKSCWSRKLAIQRTFAAAVATIVFPDDMGADITSFRYIEHRLELSMAGIAGSSDPAHDLSDLGVFSSASVDFLQVTSNLRQDLGILTSPLP